MKIGIFNFIMALNFNTLLTRALTAAVFVAVLMSAINYNYFTFSLLFFVIAIWGLHEFYKISEKLGAKPLKITGYISGVFFISGAFWHNAALPGFNFPVFYAAGIISLFVMFIQAMFSDSENPITDVAYTIAGVVYSVVPFCALYYVSCIDKTIIHSEFLNFNSSYNNHIVLGIFLLIWANDTYAYLVGSLIGKNKLFERISPGKTWEGTIGSAILTVASAFLVAYWFPEVDRKHWLVLSLIAVVIGTLGDLSESLLKRKAGIKDSGRIMPGHGGILDRFDSLMFIAPFAYLYLSLVYA